MGSSLGPVLANIILTEFENIIVSDLINTGVIKFYRRYVDDTLVLIRPSDIPHVLAKFNSFDKNIKFTIDDFSDSDVHFLDLKIADDGIYEFKCPGCGQTYIGKTERNLQTRLTHHATN
jgi:hypothetical protein